MPFYKFVLKTGHCGAGKNFELPIYLYAVNYTEAIRGAKNFPAVKHDARSIINSYVVDEPEFVKGILTSSYNIINHNGSAITDINKLCKKIIRINDYEFKTELGKQLEGFCRTYINASPKVKEMVEREYYNWASGIVGLKAETGISV